MTGVVKKRGRCRPQAGAGGHERSRSPAAIGSKASSSADGAVELARLPRQQLPVLRRREADHRPHPLAKRQPAQAHRAVLGRDDVDVAARRRHRPAEAGDDARERPALGRARQGDDRRAARRAAGGADEVDLPADRADVVAADALGVDLAGEIDLERRVDRDIALQPRQHVERMRVAHGAELDGRVAVREAVEPGVGAEQDARDADARVHPLRGVGDDAALDQVDERVADHPRVDAEVAPVREHRDDRFGNRAEADLQRRAVGNERVDVRRDPALELADRRARQLDRLPVGFDEHVDVGFVERDVARRLRHLAIHLGDDDARLVDRGACVVGAEAEAEAPARIRRSDLHQRDVAGDRPVLDEFGVLRDVARDDVHRTGLDQAPVGADAAHAAQLDAVDLAGQEGVGEHRGEERAHAAELAALAHQRLGERQRLGRPLAHDDAVAGAHPAAQVELASSDADHGLARASSAASRSPSATSRSARLSSGPSIILPSKSIVPMPRAVASS